jgi:integrase
MMAFIYKRGSVWWVCYWAEGQRHREPAGPTEKKAKALLAKRTASVLDGQPVIRRNTSLGQCIKLLVDRYGLEGRRSLPRALRAVRNFIAFISPHHTGDPATCSARASGITGRVLQSYITERAAQKAAPATIRQELAIVRRALRLAVGAGMLAEMPPFPTITVRNAKTGFFEEDEFRRLMAALDEDVRPLVEFLWWTGWRKSEAMGLQWKNADLDVGTIRIETSKNDEPRTLPFRALPELDLLLRSQKARVDRLRLKGLVTPWVFFWSDGSPIKEPKEAWKAACIEAGLAQVVKDEKGRIVSVKLTHTLHDLRRTAVRRMERYGVSRSVAMKVTGHKTESIYTRYAIVAEADIAEGLAKVARKAGK